MNAASTEPAQYGRDDSQDEQAEAYRRALASTEPAQYGRDDFIIDPGHGLEIVASTEPAQYGRDDRERCGGAARGRPRLNGARPVRAGRRRAVAAERGPGRASTEPAQYGRDDHEGQLMILSGLNASTEPAQYGRDDAVGGHSGLGDEVAASTEPAQYGRDDATSAGYRVATVGPPQRSPPSTGGTTRLAGTARRVCRSSLNGARPVRAGRRRVVGAPPRGRLVASTEPAQYGRDDGPETVCRRGVPRSLNGARPVRAGRLRVPRWARASGSPPQRSPPSTGGTTDLKWVVLTRVSTPQRSPPSTGGTTLHDKLCGLNLGIASTEPAQYGRDDETAHMTDPFASAGLNGARPVRAGRPVAPPEEERAPDAPQRSPPSTGGTTWAARSSSRRPAPPQRSPPSTGGTTRMSPWSGSTSPGLNGARPVRAGRLGRDVDLRADAGASTEPAQYGRDDQPGPQQHPRGGGLPQRSPPSTGGTTTRWRRRRSSRRTRLNGARPVRAGRPARTSRCQPRLSCLNGARPVRAGRPATVVGTVTGSAEPQRSPPSTGGTIRASRGRS